METTPNPGLVALLWIVRIYRYLVIAWVVMTWIPGIAGSPLHDIVGIPVTPVLNLFSFLSIGPIGLGGILLLLLLWPIESYLERAVAPPKESEPGFDVGGGDLPDLARGHRSQRDSESTE